MAKVIAKERGHDGTQIREEGEVFEVPDSRLEDGSTWFEPVDGPLPVKQAVDSRPPGAGPAKGSAQEHAASAPGAPNRGKAK